MSRAVDEAAAAAMGRYTELKSGICEAGGGHRDDAIPILEWHTDGAINLASLAGGVGVGLRMGQAVNAACQLLREEWGPPTTIIACFDVYFNQAAVSERLAPGELAVRFEAGDPTVTEALSVVAVDSISQVAALARPYSYSETDTTLSLVLEPAVDLPTGQRPGQVIQAMLAAVMT